MALTTDLIILGLDTTEQIWMTNHTTNPPGWQPQGVYGNVSQAADGGDFTSFSGAGSPNGSLQVVALNQNGVWHARSSGSTWTNLFGNIAGQIHTGKPFTSPVGNVSCCTQGGDVTSDGTLHLCGLYNDGNGYTIWYTSVDSLGNWTDPYETVDLPSGAANPQNVQCAVTSNGNVHLLLVDAIKGIYHTYRTSTGWVQSYDGPIYPINTGAVAESIALATTASNKVVFVGMTSTRTFSGYYDTIEQQWSTTTFFPQFVIPPNDTAVQFISCALTAGDNDTNQNLYVVYATIDGVLKYSLYDGIVLDTNTQPVTTLNVNAQKTMVPAFFNEVSIVTYPVTSSMDSAGETSDLADDEHLDTGVDQGDNPGFE